MSTTVIQTRKSPGWLIQLLWFFFIGVWLGQVWIIAAWLLMLTIIGIPIGISMLNKLPKIIALREPQQQIQILRRPDGSYAESEYQKPQVFFLIRMLYFLLIGWWFSAIWMELAYVLTATIIFLPIGFWMFDRVPAVLTLRR